MKSGITKWNGDELVNKAGDALIRAMKHSCLYLEGDIKKNFTKKGSGRKYGIHRASLPGQPPAINTGALRASTGHEIQQTATGLIGYVGINDALLTQNAIQGLSKKRMSISKFHKKLTKAIASGLKRYGFYLEVGTAKMAPRPYLRPALARCDDAIKGFFRDYIRKVFQ